MSLRGSSSPDPTASQSSANRVIIAEPKPAAQSQLAERHSPQHAIAHPHVKSWTSTRHAPATSLNRTLAIALSTTPRLDRGLNVYKATTRGRWTPRVLTLSQD
ncbi:hypothetical protein MPSEU_000158000 [Mayamaea pseudoterrestris]|nr:hypothetical protein MPSEU_000158000 [Mayamaea pseudoterrestris]